VGGFTFDTELGIFLAIAAVVLGAVGIVLSILPGRRGGLLSAISVLLGVVGVAVAIIRIIL